MPETMQIESPVYMNEDSSKAMKEAWERHENEGKEFRADSKTATLDIYGPITNYQLKQVSNFLAAVKGKDLTVRVNSPGGDYFAGLSIANRLAEHNGKIHTVVDGLAASAAAVVFMAGDTREMKPSSQLMFHPVMTIAFGNRFDMEKVIKQLKASDEAMADFITGEGKINLKKDELENWLQKEEFMGRDDARKIGAVNFDADEEKKKKEMDAEDEEKKKKEMDAEDEEKKKKEMDAEDEEKKKKEITDEDVRIFENDTEEVKRFKRRLQEKMVAGKVEDFENLIKSHGINIDDTIAERLGF